MVSVRLLTRLGVMLMLSLVALGLSACYKDAGGDAQPTNGQTGLSRSEQTNTPVPSATSTPDAAATATPTVMPGPAVTTPVPTVGTLQPTITDAAAVTPGGPTNTPPLVAPSFTPASTIAPPTESVITTPETSDIQPSFTPLPTTDPALRPTPTGIPVEDNPCVHMVQPSENLFRIALEYEVELAALVAANPTLLGGSENTPLQIGWELQIPGCATATPEPTPAVEEGTPVVETPVPGTKTTYEVQAGDTIYSIARQYGVDPQTIIEANNLVNPSLIYAGQILIIPATE